MKKLKFAEGGRFSEKDPDIYARARRFVESGGKKEEDKPASKPAPKAAAPAPAPAAEKPKEAPAERASDTSKRFPSETPASKDDTPKSVSERMKESRERSRTSNTGTDTRSVSERIFGTKTKTEEAPTKRAEIPTSADGPKAPASTGESTSGPSNVDRVLAATGVGAGALGLANLAKRAYNATRPADRIAKAIESAKIGGKSTTPIVQSTKTAEKYSPKQQLEAGESALRGAVNRSKIASKRSDAEAGAPKGSSFKDSPTRGKKTSYADDIDVEYKKGGKVKKYAAGGSVGSASRRADGIATKGKTKCRIM